MNNDDPWISYIKSEHERIVNRYNIKIAPDIKRVFLKNRRAVNNHTTEYSKEYGKQTSYRNELSRLVEKSYKDIKSETEDYAFQAKIHINAAKKAVCHKNRILPYVEAIPTMFSWVPIQKNIIVDDEPVLKNIPYVADSESKADDQFVNELLEDYEGKVHGGIGGYMNDVILADLVQSLMKFHSQRTNQKPQSLALPNGSVRRNATLSTTTAPSMSDMIVFEKISECFPDKGTALELKEKYRILAKGQSSTEPGPNIDESSQPITSCTNQPNPDQIMHSYHTLLCQRCKIYDCCIHKYKQPAPKMIRAPMKTSYYDPKRPSCSNDCYLVRHKVYSALAIDDDVNDKERIMTRRSAGDGSSSKQNSSWTYGEVAIYKVFYI